MKSSSKWLAEGASAGHAAAATMQAMPLPSFSYFNNLYNCFELLNHLGVGFLQDPCLSMCCPYRQKGYHRCFRRLPAFEHTQQSVHELIWLRGTRSAIRWRRRSLTVCSRRMRRQQTYRRRRTSSRLHRKFRSRLRCASKSLRRNVSCCKATNQ